MHIENNDIVIALSIVMLQPATEIDISYLNPICIMTIVCENGRTGKENLTQVS